MPPPRERLIRSARAVRRAVLRRRRLLAGVLAAVAVTAGINAVSAAPPTTVEVLVAAHDLPAGTTLAADDLRPVQFAPGSVPSAVEPAAVGRTLAAPLRRGEPVIDLRLLGPALTETYPGLTALPVRLPDAGMVELLRVGDRIDLVAADPQGTAARTVATGVPVLAIPQASEDPGVTGLAGRLVVVGAHPSEVPRIADAAVRYFVTFAFSG